jgi:hypothetical protein
MYQPSLLPRGSLKKFAYPGLKPLHLDWLFLPLLIFPCVVSFSRSHDFRQHGPVFPSHHTHALALSVIYVVDLLLGDLR